VRNTVQYVGDSHCSFSLANKMVTTWWGHGRNWWMSLPEKNTKYNLCKVRTELCVLAIHKICSLSWILTRNHFILVPYELKSNHFDDTLLRCWIHIWFAWKYTRTYSTVFFISGVGLSPLGTAATSGLLYKPQMIDEGDCGAIGGMKIGRGNRSTRRKPAPGPLCPPQIPHDQTRARTRAAAVESQLELWRGLWLNLMYYDLCNSSFLNMLLCLLKMVHNLNKTCKGISYKYIIESHWKVLSNYSTIFNYCDGQEWIKLRLPYICIFLIFYHK
jgi:hypothetical protein